MYTFSKSSMKIPKFYIFKVLALMHVNFYNVEYKKSFICKRSSTYRTHCLFRNNFYKYVHVCTYPVLLTRYSIRKIYD